MKTKILSILALLLTAVTQGAWAQIGMTNGLFSVSATKRVYFSKGNLQYDGTNWKFAASQWEVLGANGTGATGTATNYPMDLFTWGNIDSPTYNGNTYYTENADLSGITDWGSRMGSGWYTLSKDEWLYLFGMESNNTDKSGHARYRKYFRAKVNGVSGIVVLPDDLSGISDIPAESSRGTASNFNGKTYTTDAWSAMESAGCVFLPAAGFRNNGTSVMNVGSSGFYWPSTANGSGSAFTVGFDLNNVFPANNFNRNLGFSVRLVIDGITLDKNEAQMTIGNAMTLTATVVTPTGDKTVTWTTSDASVATVADGVVTAVAAGTATITATATNGTADTGDDVSATCTVNVVYPWAGSGTADDPFQIQNVDDWNTLAANVTGGETYSGIYFKMTDDIIGVTTRTGKNSVNPFSGTFDGQGHTMNLNIYTTTTDDVTSAPFGYISGATIKNLHITGSETTTAYMRAASIAGFAANSTITNCWSEVALTSGYNKDIDCGAFVATVIKNSSLTLNGCLFTGTITYTNAAGYEGGGMVGWTRDGGTATLNDCLFAPASFTVTNYSGHYMFVGGKKRGVLNNCYYNDVAAATSLTKEGKQAFSIVKGDDVSSLAISGEGTEYSVSGITAYATGIKYNDVYYAGSGESVSLALSHADAAAGYSFNEYTATAGTLSGTTLTMPDANVTINATWTENTTTLTDGDDLSALSAWAGKTCTVTYTRSFTAGKPSTVCLPFAYTPQGEEKFYSFTGINEDGGNYTADMTEVVSPLVANTPYLFMPTGNANFSGTYAIPASITAGETTSGDWTFKGTYSTIEWTSAPAEPTYGFSAQDANDGITQGQFVKVGSYVRIKPMRAYLQYNGSDSQFINARSLTRAAATTNDDTLPETIGVRLISANGEVTAIGTLHTRTGEVSFDSEAWYTLDGKRLNAKPNTKGIYVNNGKNVVIK